MNPLLKKTLLAVAGAALAAQSASAGNSYNANSDALLMFKASGAANDVIFDLGAVSQFTTGQSFNLATIGYNPALLPNVSSSLGSLEWTLVASTTGGTPKGVAVTDEGGLGVNIGPFGNNTAAAGAAGSVNASGTAYSAILGTGILSAHAVMIGTAASGSYTANGDDLAGSLNGEASVLNSDFSGVASAEFEKFTGTGNPLLLGSITFDETSGQMMFNAVPEPAAYRLLGAGLLALALGRRLGRRKLA